MPRKRKAAREFRKPVRASVAEMLRRYDTPAARFFAECHPDRFHQEFPTLAERTAYLTAFPEAYTIWDFFSHVTDEYPASCHFHFRFFRRPKTEFLKLLRNHPPRVPFDPPADVWQVHFFPERIEALARLRGGWYVANQWPMTPEERAWLRQGPREKEFGRGVVPMPYPTIKTNPGSLEG